MANDEQLDVFDVQSAATPHERSQQRPEREVEKREGHGRRSSQPAREGRDTIIGALQDAAARYTYDPNGNRDTVDTAAGILSASYDDQDRLEQDGVSTYEYTSAGELARKSTRGLVTTYTYDELGNLLAAILPAGTQIEYVIDGRNRRIGKKADGAIVQAFLYRNDRLPIAELHPGGGVKSLFVYARGDVPAYMTQGDAAYRIIRDHTGSPRLIVNAATGDVAQRIDYDAFGNIELDTNPGFQPFGFGGGIYDRDTKLVRFGARDYDAETGRWTTQDPARFIGGPNLYAFVNNDPVNRRDPTGLGDDDYFEEWDRYNKKRTEAVLKMRDELLISCTSPLMFMPMYTPGPDIGEAFDYTKFGPWFWFGADSALTADDFNDWIGPSYRAAKSMLRAEEDVRQEIRREREAAKAVRQHQELTRVFNSLGLYYPWQAPKVSAGR